MRGQAGAPVDLLRERRIELGLPAQPAPFVPTRLLLRRGALLGGAVLLVSGAITAAVNWRGQQQQQQLKLLEPVAQRVTAAEAQLRRLKTKTTAVNKKTDVFAQQLVAFPGGSPLLEQLRRITPEGIQLQELLVGEAQIKLLGWVQIGKTPGPLERINALVLSLSQLPITREQGVEVTKITREDGDDPAVTFSVDWALNPKVRLSLIQLQDLEAIGLAYRYRLLKRRGVSL
ncbi:PilN domain-containing protein [Synechococcus sp. ROS8604]|uniref:PilN domain-containing protein n=1 Tax=Synechococcus sp. ROS8604 TaxID=1442557 RepID=UPI0016480D0C|nr:PilN domain-containing protein [Synechococcus sp. ROS8604]QNI90164.1 fimbrial assembly family protein [Synechococcus sp. ROS8604]